MSLHCLSVVILFCIFPFSFTFIFLTLLKHWRLIVWLSYFLRFIAKNPFNWQLCCNIIRVQRVKRFSQYFDFSVFILCQSDEWPALWKICIIYCTPLITLTLSKLTISLYPLPCSLLYHWMSRERFTLIHCLILV